MPRTALFLAPDGSLAVEARVLEQLFDQMPDTVFFIKDDQGRYQVVNHSLVERNGLQTKEQLLGRRVADVYPGELGRAHASQDEAVLRTGRPLLDHLELHWHQPNQPCWCLTTKLPLKNEEGRITGLIGISRDVRAPVAPGEIPAGVSRALHHLEQNFAEAVTPASLARLAGLEQTRFARLVKRIHGITPSQLIIKTRVAAATRLLQETERSVAEISLECGFYDHSSLTRAFRSTTGMSPTQFRTNRR